MPAENQQNSDEYSVENIKRITPREHVRMRSGMYIGGTDQSALHQMIWEVLDDAISEFEDTTPTYNEITITLLPDRTICVSDNGKGLPVDKTESGQAKVEMYMTRIGMVHRHQFVDGESFRLAGLNGTGLLSINALSTSCQVEVKRDGFLWRQSYSEGLPIAPLEQIRPLEAGESTGTSIRFRPDFSIMEENDFDFDLIANHSQELAYLLPHLHFTVEDKRETKQKISFHYPEGLSEWVKNWAENPQPVCEVLRISHICDLVSSWDKHYEVKIELALQWFEGDTAHLCSFVNRQALHYHSYQLGALEFALKKYLKIRNWDRLKDGLVCIIHILHPDPQFESQARMHLLNSDVYTAVDEAVEALFASHPETKEAIQDHFRRK